MVHHIIMKNEVVLKQTNNKVMFIFFKTCLTLI